MISSHGCDVMLAQEPATVIRAAPAIHYVADGEEKIDIFASEVSEGDLKVFSFAVYVADHSNRFE